MRLVPSLVVLNAAVLACGAVVSVGAQSERVAAPAAAAPDAAQVVQVPVPVATPLAVPSAAPVAPAPATAAPAPQPRAVVRPSARPRVRPPAPLQRRVVRTGWRPYAVVGPVTLHYPGDVVEVVGLHQSGHDGALPQQPVKGPAPIGRLGSRARGTSPQGSADIVVDPRREVRSPVTGTVLRAGTYTLYCDYVDDYVVVEPEARPGWEVKLLHFEGLQVSKGDRVEAGVTVVGTRARVLPFPSQVDKHTVTPHWPHLHLEVVDTAVPDRPSTGSCD